MSKRILVFAPHPDDEVLGCGGTIAKHSAKGDEVYLCVVTKAYEPDWSKEFIENRPNEVKKVNEILGIKKTFFLDFLTAKMDTVPQKEINDAFARVISEVNPDIVYTTHQGDVHKDHRLTLEAVLIATRPSHSNVKKILAYETLSETEWGNAIIPFIPNVFVDISNFFQKKIEAMQVYNSELKEFPHPRSKESIEAKAKSRGAEARIHYAEAFMLMREIK